MGLLVGLSIWALSSRAGARGELDALQDRTAELQHLVTFFSQGRVQLAKDRPELAHQYFPLSDDPQTTKPKKGHKGAMSVF